MRLGIGLVGGIIGAVFSVTNASAQRATQPCTTPGGISIAGTVIDDSTRQPIAGSNVFLLFTNCRTTTDENGRFRFELVRPGVNSLEAQQVGYRRFRPIQLNIDHDSTDFVVALRPGGPIEDCRVHAACSQLLNETEVDLSEEDHFKLIALATMIALAWQTAANEPMWYACVVGASDEVISELRARYARTVPNSACGMGPPIAPRSLDRMVLAANGQPAFRIRIDNVEVRSPLQRRAGISYFVDGRSGQGWRCDFQRSGLSWTPVLCVHEWES
jgi:hypothetical protein